MNNFDNMVAFLEISVRAITWWRKLLDNMVVKASTFHLQLLKNKLIFFMADKLIIDWKEYNLIVEKLAIQIHQSGFKPDMLIGIMRGGAPIIDVLSRVFKLKCAYLAVESYSGEGTEDQQGELVFSREMSSTVQEMKGNILLCDDLSDTGVTLNKSIDWLKKYPPLQGKIKSIKTAVLWKKKDSTFEPDYCAQKLNSNPWIVQPFEHYEEVRVEDLIKKHQGS